MNEPTKHEPDAPADPHAAAEPSARTGRPIRYSVIDESHMLVDADVETFTRYLDAHPEWFTRCAAPMEVRALDPQSYAITIGRFGAFDYYVEPKIGLRLMSQVDGIYWTHSIPVPGHVHPSYDVDFKSSMELLGEARAGTGGAVTTKVKWTLRLGVNVWFPGFVRILPEKLLQSTGDRMLNGIVRQVSKRFTRKVLEDFHGAMDRPIPDQNPAPAARDTP